VNKHGVLIEQIGPYNLYEIDFGTERNTSIEYNPAEQDLIAQIKKLLRPR
jgi:hypothetical protein